MIQFRLFPGERASKTSSGVFPESLSLLWQESIVLDIRNGPFSTGCFFIISSGSSRNMRAGSSGTTDISGRSSRR